MRATMEFFKATRPVKGKDAFCGIIKAEDKKSAAHTFKRHFGTDNLLITRAFVNDGLIIKYRPKTP